MLKTSFSISYAFVSMPVLAHDALTACRAKHDGDVANFAWPAGASEVGQLGVELSFPTPLKRPQNIASCGRRAQKFMAMKSYPNPAELKPRCARRKSKCVVPKQEPGFSCRAATETL
jgi:hypothetical protein